MTFATDDLLKTHVLVVHPPTAPRPEHHSGNDAEGRQDNAENNNHSPPSENKTAANAPTVSSADMGSEPVFCIGCKTNFEDGAEFQDHLLTCGFDDEESKEADVSPERPAERKTPRPRTPRQTPGTFVLTSWDVCTNVDLPRTCSSESLLIAIVVFPGKSPRGPQKCQECGKQFADNYCLRRHMISHTGAKCVSALRASCDFYTSVLDRRIIDRLKQSSWCFVLQVRRTTHAMFVGRSLLILFT